jgi:hypothetical protein
MTHKVRLGEWIRLESIESKTDERSKVDDISVVFRVSPYDVPEAIRGSFDTNTRCLRIDLRYLADEPMKETQLDDGAVLHVGKNSGRLYGIELPPVPGGVGKCEVLFEIERLEKAIADARPGFKRPRNLALAENAIRSHMVELVEAVAI